MGRFKRSKSRKRLRPLDFKGVQLPERLKNIVPVVNEVLFKLCKQKILKSYQVLGLRMNGGIFSFEIKFPFWSNVSPHLHLFLCERNPTECAITQTKYRLSFELLLGDQVTFESVYKHFCDWIDIIQSGLRLEERVVENLNSYYQQSNQPYRVRHSTEEEDQHQKFDVVVDGFHKPFGIQLKKNVREWNEHKKQNPNVPSIYLSKADPKTLASAVKQIAESLKDKRIEHINLNLTQKPPT